MSDSFDRPEDETLRELLRSDQVEPDPALDARILAAARETPPSVPKRRWRYPVGVGAAASALLAIALLLQTQETAETIGRLKPGQRDEFVVPRTPSPDATTDEQLIDRPTRLPGPAPERTMNEATVRRSPAPPIVPQVARPAERSTAPSAVTELTTPAVVPPELDEPISADRRVMYESASAHVETPPDAGCPQSSNAIEGEGLRLCIRSDRIEILDLSPDGCRQPLILERAAGPVGLQRADGAVAILVGGEARWQVRCEKGIWHVDARN